MKAKKEPENKGVPFPADEVAKNYRVYLRFKNGESCVGTFTFLEKEVIDFFHKVATVGWVYKKGDNWQAFGPEEYISGAAQLIPSENSVG